MSREQTPCNDISDLILTIVTAYIIKHDVTSALVLLMPNSTEHFVLVSDTSKIGCGAALYQKQKGKYHLIAYYSKI